MAVTPDPVAVERGVQPLVEALVAAGGSSLAAVIFFGSRLLGSSPNVHSAADLFVVVDEYQGFYRHFTARSGIHKSARALAFWNRLLPPNILAFEPGTTSGAGGKCFVMSRQDLQRALSLRARDHFCRGRLGQQVRIVHTRDDGVRQQLETWLEEGRRTALAWVPHYLERSFAPADFCLRMLEISYRGEIRPETADRVREVFEAQRGDLVSLYGQVLEHGVREGRLAEEPGERYALALPSRLWDRLRWRAFFRWSKVRATLRWVKYVATYDDWLDYIVRKVERRTGIQLDLTPNERRFPLILGWPKAFRVLRALRAQTSVDPAEPPPKAKTP